MFNNSTRIFHLLHNNLLESSQDT